jgi:hypothetical protein
LWPARGLSDFISAASILRLCEAVKVQFSDPYKNVDKTKVLYNFKIISILTFLKIVIFNNNNNPLGRPRRRWEDDIKMDLQEVGRRGMDWIELAQYRDRWRGLMYTVMNPRAPKNGVIN